MIAGAVTTGDEAERQGGDQISLREMAYDLIKRRIITCTFKPGEYLNEAAVSASLGIGRTPVRQAIDRLMVDGLIEVIPRKGMIVKPISLNEVSQIIDVRLLNEGHCVRLAAERADQKEIGTLSDILDRTAQGVAARDNEQMMLLDREFHGVLAMSSRNAVLAELLGRLHDRSLRFWSISLNAPGHHAAVQEQHQQILAAIRDRDPEGAEQAMRAHIEAFRRNIMQTF